MNATCPTQAQVSTSEQDPSHADSRRVYAAPKLTTFGSVSTLTAGGSGGGVETGQNQNMGARP